MYPYRFLFVVVVVLFLVGCDNTRPDDFWPNAFDLDASVQLEVSPTSIVSSAPNIITVSVLPIYSGKGRFIISGNGIGDSVGQVITPAHGELGTVEFPADFTAGETAWMVWEVTIDPAQDHVGITASALLDSLVLDEGLYANDSPEVRAAIGLTLYSIDAYTTLTRRNDG